MDSMHDIMKLIKEAGLADNENMAATAAAFQKSFQNVSGLVSGSVDFKPVSVTEIKDAAASKSEAVDMERVSEAIYDGAAVAVSMEKDNLKTATEKKSLSDRLFSLGYDAQKVFARSVMSGIEIMGNFFRETRKSFAETVKTTGSHMKRNIACLTLAMLLFTPAVGRIATEKSVFDTVKAGEQVVSLSRSEKQSRYSLSDTAMRFLGVQPAEAIGLGDILGGILYEINRSNYSARNIEYKINRISNMGDNAGYIVAGMLLDALSGSSSSRTSSNQKEKVQKEEPRQNTVSEEIITKERERFQSTIDRLSARGDKDTLKMLTVVLENDKNTRIGTFQSLVNDGISIENVVYRMHADKDVLHFFKLFSRVEEEHKKTAIVQIFEYMGIDDIEMPNRNEIFR